MKQGQPIVHFKPWAPHIISIQLCLYFISTSRVYPDFASLGSHFERREPLIVLDVLQLQLGVQPGSGREDAVVHAGDELRVLLRVVGHHHQSVQHCVALRVRHLSVHSLVLVLHEEFDYVGLVGAGCQGQRQLT